MTWTRRRCPECNQLVVEEQNETVPCPSCGALVGPQSVEPTPVEPEQEESVAQVSPDPEPVDEEQASPQEWNLGEPMHRVFYLCLTAPDRVPLATMFRSLRWILAFGWLGQICIQMSGLLMASALLQVSADEIALTRDFALAVEKNTAGGPEAQRQRDAQQQLCTMTMLTPAQRLACAFDPALQPLSDLGLRAKQRIDAMDRLQKPSEPSAWLGSVFNGLLFFMLGVFPLWLILGLARQPEAWSLALRATAFGQVPMVVGAVLAAPVMLVGGSLGVSIGVMILVGVALWSLALVAGFLIRLGSMAPRQALMMVLVVVLFELMIVTSMAAAA